MQMNAAGQGGQGAAPPVLAAWECDTHRPQSRPAKRYSARLRSPPQTASETHSLPLLRPQPLPLQVGQKRPLDTPTLERGGILGSTKPLKLDSLRRLAQRWDSPQALLSECPSVVAFLQVLFGFDVSAQPNGLKQYASKTDSSSSCESFTVRLSSRPKPAARRKLEQCSRTA